MSCLVYFIAAHCFAGWCYRRVVPNSKGQIDHSTTVVAEVLGYELWFYGTLVSLVAIYITMLCYLKFKVGTPKLHATINIILAVVYSSCKISYENNSCKKSV